VYYIPAESRRRIEEFSQAGGNVDAPGYFIEWLVKHDDVYGFMTDGAWFDIGSHDAYRQAVQEFIRRRS
jgi:glucose-1-phosphate thymidylyltransferase